MTEPGDFIQSHIFDRYRFPPGMGLLVAIDDERDCTFLNMTLRVTDVVTGDPCVTNKQHIIEHDVLRNVRQDLRAMVIDDTVKMLANTSWQHELDEWFTINGKHVKEPHQ
jgi:hypothetical protein